MKLKVKLGLSLVVVGILMGISGRQVWAAPHFSLVPSTGTLAVGDTMVVKIAVDTGTEKSQAMDAWLTYNKNILQILTVVKAADAPAGYDYTISPHWDNTAGTFDTPFVSGEDNVFGATTVAGNLAYITFRSVAAGTANVNFTCTPGSTTDSNIFRSQSSSDVISCADNVNGVYTVTSGGSQPTSTPTPGASGPTATPGPTGIPDPTSTPIIHWPGSTVTPTVTPSTLPKTGNVEETVGMLSVGGVLILLSVLVLRFL